jgi:hypothetical protein
MKLQVKSSDSAILLLQNSTTSGTDIKTGLYYKTGNNYSGAIASVGSNSTFRLGFYTYGGSTPSSLLERLSIMDGGDIGIGTTSPLAQLHVSNINENVALLENTTALNTNINTGLLYKTGTQFTGAIKTIGTGTTSARLGIFTNASSVSSGLLERISVRNNGFVGIGTTAPNEQLSVQTASNFAGITHTDGTIKVGTFVGGNGAGGYFGTISNHPLYFMTNNGAAQFTLLQNGNVGIGNTNPTASLVVARGSGAGGTAQFVGTTNSSHFNYSTGEETYIRGGKATSQVVINDVSSGNVRLAEGGGNVGIDVDAPAAKLHIKNNASNMLEIENSNALSASNSSRSEIYFKTGNYFTSTIRNYGTAATTASVGIFTGSSTDGTGLVERLTITNNGNIGIGTNDPKAPLHVFGGLGTAIQISGGIKVSGLKSAFQLAIDVDNAILIGGIGDNKNDIRGFVIDNILSNGKPDALIFVTGVDNSLNTYVTYNASTSKWECYAQLLSTKPVIYYNRQVTKHEHSIYNDAVEGESVSFISDGNVGVLNLPQAGYKYNILIINQ